MVFAALNLHGNFRSLYFSLLAEKKSHCYLEIFVLLIGLYLPSANVFNGCLDSRIISGFSVRCHVLFTKILVDEDGKELLLNLSH